MQFISLGDNLHEMLNPIFWENKKNIFSLSSAEFFPNMKSGFEATDLDLYKC